MYNSVLNIRITSVYGSQPSSVVFAFKTATLWPQLHMSLGPRSHLRPSACKPVCLASESLVSIGPSPHLLVLHAKQRLWIRITNLYGSQTSPVVLCMQSSMIRNRNTCLYCSQPLSLVFSCKTAPFGAELQVCMGPSLHLSFCACKTAWLTSEILVSRGPSPLLWCLDAKERLSDQNNESPWVPALTCRFVHANQRT